MAINLLGNKRTLYGMDQQIYTRCLITISVNNNQSHIMSNVKRFEDLSYELRRITDRASRSDKEMRAYRRMTKGGQKASNDSIDA